MGIDKDQKEKYMQYQFLISQINQLQQYLVAVNKQIISLNTLNKEIEDFSQVKENSNVLVPLDSGVFFEGQVKNNKNLKVNVGAGVVVEKTIDETKTLILKQIGELEETMVIIENQLQAIADRSEEIRKDLENFNEK